MSAVAAKRRRSVGSVVLIVVGSVLGLIALALLAGGGAVLWADKTQREDNGYFMSARHRVATSSYAITHEGTEVGGARLVDLGKLARVRIAATSATGRPIFLGIARERAAQAYLADVAHARLRDFDLDPFRATYDRVPGSQPPTVPEARDIWSAAASDTTRATLTWPVEKGTWVAVVMNADGSRGVAADVRVGADLSYLGWIWAGLLIAGVVLLVTAVLLVVVGARGLGTRHEASAPVASP